MREIKNCPWCGSVCGVFGVCMDSQVQCHTCRCCGPLRGDMDEAISCWNESAEISTLKERYELEAEVQADRLRGAWEEQKMLERALVYAYAGLASEAECPYTLSGECDAPEDTELASCRYNGWPEERAENRSGCFYRSYRELAKFGLGYKKQDKKEGDDV